ncbi:TetR/AcrR family transcriptional regulator [Companilactobacillus kimchiensis]|uniref:Transcriptional regulator, TetR family n=1 Tax=Companilactobacillus kimchiensis TaxID=993692 RepID=A0A0R2LPW7_9LACO|nr:TetR/AcrR family transcriptional regulator [Companilactobacillus kimchiensis]KRO00410.1 transcriptional regulator, TetR family [Companilactobacillus kimchiensis]
MDNQFDIYREAEKTEKLTPKQKLIFQSAIELFSDQGYANTSTKEISEHAGVSEGSIFRKFKNKEDLLMAILEPLTHEILPQDLDEFSRTTYQDGNLNLKYFLTTMINDRIKLFKYNHKIMKIFLNEFIYNRQIHDRLVESIPKKSFKQFNEVLDELKEKQLLINWDNLEIFRFLASNILGYLIQHYIIVDTTEWNETSEIEHVTDFIVKGLTPTK